MSPTELLDQISATGVHLTRAGNDLLDQIAPGVSVGPCVDEWLQHTPALIALLSLQDEIETAARAATTAFDRQHYDELWQCWYALQEEST